MEKLLPVLLLAIALLAVALWHARARRPDDRHADARPTAETEAQPKGDTIERRWGLRRDRGSAPTTHLE